MKTWGSNLSYKQNKRGLFSILNHLNNKSYATFITYIYFDKFSYAHITSYPVNNKFMNKTQTKILITNLIRIQNLS